MSKNGMRLLGRVGLLLGIAQVLLVILSWLLSATRMEGVRSLLSSEGVRWFIGCFTQMIASVALVWLLLLFIALGCIQKSGVPKLFTTSRQPLSYRERIALRVSLAFLIIFLGIVSLLNLMPHAILLSATGSLFPSAFSHSLVPLTCFGISLFSISFGMMSGRLRSLADIMEALSFGIQKGAPLLVVYILFMQFYESLWFVFG